MRGGEVKSLASEYTCTPNGSGGTTKGVGIAIAQHTTNEPIDATIGECIFVVPENSNAVKLSISNPENNTFDSVSVKSTQKPEGKIPDGFQHCEHANALNDQREDNQYRDA